MNFYATMQARSVPPGQLNMLTSPSWREEYWDQWEYDPDRKEQDEEPRDSLSPLDDIGKERESAFETIQRPSSMEKRT